MHGPRPQGFLGYWSARAQSIESISKPSPLILMCSQGWNWILKEGKPGRRYSWVISAPLLMPCCPGLCRSRLETAFCPWHPSMGNAQLGLGQLKFPIAFEAQEIFHQQFSLCQFRSSLAWDSSVLQNHSQLVLALEVIMYGKISISLLLGSHSWFLPTLEEIPLSF